MKILIISDTHRKHDNLLKVLERECPVDLLIHLGDAEGYEDYIAEQAGCPVEVVAGNNDFFSSLPREKLRIEQNANMALKTANLGYVMETGRITLHGSGEELLANEAVKAAYLGT